MPKLLSSPHHLSLRDSLRGAVFLPLLVPLLLSGCAGEIEAARTLPDERDAQPDDEPASDGSTGRSPDAGAPVSDASAPDLRGDARTRDDGSAPDATSDAGAPTSDAGPALGKSAGCGKSASGTGEFVDKSISAANLDRTYAMLVPSGYQPSRAYPLIFRFHGTGGDAKSGGLSIEQPAANNAIIVSPDGLRDVNGDQAWVETDEATDLALFDALLASVSADYCVDLDRVFSYGFSAGAGFSETLACKRGNKMRGIGAIAGWDFAGTAACEGDVAALLFHDTDDDAVTIEMGRAGRDKIRVQNGCDSQTQPTQDPDCEQYLGCNAGAPVVWCETSGLGHNIRGDVAPGKVWQFFEML